MIDDIWMVFVDFVTHPATNGLASAMAGVMTLVIGWRFVPELLVGIEALNRDRPGVGFIRVVIGVGGAAVLGLASAAGVASLAQP